MLRDDVFSSMTELILKDAKLSGKSHTFLPLSDIDTTAKDLC